MGLIDLLLKRKKETEDAGDAYDPEAIAKREALQTEMENKKKMYVKKDEPKPEDKK